MGIYDRDYIRSKGAGRRFHPEAFQPGGSIRAGFSGLSVVSWLIIINVAIFFVGGMLPSMDVNLGVVGDNGAAIKQPYAIMKNVTRVTPSPGVLAHPVQDRATGKIIGFQRYRVMPVLQGIGHFSTIKALSHIEIWRFVTYQFLHAHIVHLVLNMIGLYFFGPIVERYLGSRRLFLAFYLTCGIAGAFLYLLLNLIGSQVGSNIPGLLPHDPSTPLIGASAGVFGILMACAHVAGNARMALIFFPWFTFKIKYGAYGMLAFAVFNLFTGAQNAGGEAAHVGGAFAGWYFIRNPRHLLDFFDDFLGRAPKPGLKAARAARSQPAAAAKPRKPSRDDRRLDEILAKVSRDGLHSLTDAERAFLNQTSQGHKEG